MNVVCRHCGNVIRDGDKFCMNCGMALDMNAEPETLGENISGLPKKARKKQIPN